MGHFRPCLFVVTFCIECLVTWRAVQYRFVAADIDRDIIQCLHQLLTKVFPLVILGDGDVLDVSNYAKVMNARTVNLRFVLRYFGGKKKKTNNFLSTTTTPVPTMRSVGSRMTTQ
jgi:hypothetical protein